MIEELRVPYTAVTTDLIAGKSVWLQRGPVDEAIRASIAIPGVIKPHVLDGRLLADGGILDPLPMAPLAAVNADLNIAVSLGRRRDRRRQPEPEPGPTAELLNRMWRSTTALLDTTTARTLLDTPAARTVLSAVRRRRRGKHDHDDTPSRPCQAGRLRGDEPNHRDRAGRPDAPHAGGLSARPAHRGTPHRCRSLEFHRAEEVIDIGRALASTALDAVDLGRRGT